MLHMFEPGIMAKHMCSFVLLLIIGAVWANIAQ